MSKETSGNEVSTETYSVFPRSPLNNVDRPVLFGGRLISSQGSPEDVADGEAGGVGNIWSIGTKVCSTRQKHTSQHKTRHGVRKATRMMHGT